MRAPNSGNIDQSDAPPAAPGHMLPDPLPPEPFTLFRAWFDAAHRLKVQPNPNAMALATVGADGKPSAHIVLCKGIDPASGHIVFYTNYRGRKARDLDAHPHAAVCFHWDDLDKQVRIEGPVVKSPASESDAYFHSRPWISRVGAWTSDQSEPVGGRNALVQKLYSSMMRFGIDPEKLPGAEAVVRVPRPEHWGGYRLFAERVELWSAGEGRLHDRAEWVRTLRPTDGAFAADGPWRCTRLQP